MGLVLGYAVLWGVLIGVPSLTPELRGLNPELRWLTPELRGLTRPLTWVAPLWLGVLLVHLARQRRMRRSRHLTTSHLLSDGAPSSRPNNEHGSDSRVMGQSSES